MCSLHSRAKPTGNAVKIPTQFMLLKCLWNKFTFFARSLQIICHNFILKCFGNVCGLLTDEFICHFAQNILLFLLIFYSKWWDLCWPTQDIVDSFWVIENFPRIHASKRGIRNNSVERIQVIKITLNNAQSHLTLRNFCRASNDAYANLLKKSCAFYLCVMRWDHYKKHSRVIYRSFFVCTKCKCIWLRAENWAKG